MQSTAQDFLVIFVEFLVFVFFRFIVVVKEKEKIMCEHVYKIIGMAICPICSKPTRETDWQKIHEQHREWIASGKSVQQGWWSI